VKSCTSTATLLSSGLSAIRERRRCFSSTGSRGGEFLERGRPGGGGAGRVAMRGGTGLRLMRWARWGEPVNKIESRAEVMVRGVARGGGEANKIGVCGCSASSAFDLELSSTKVSLMGESGWGWLDARTFGLSAHSPRKTRSSGTPSPSLRRSLSIFCLLKVFADGMTNDGGRMTESHGVASKDGLIEKRASLSSESDEDVSESLPMRIDGREDDRRRVGIFSL
jgi:hypothetical protein